MNQHKKIENVTKSHQIRTFPMILGGKIAKYKRTVWIDANSGEAYISAHLISMTAFLCSQIDGVATLNDNNQLYISLDWVIQYFEENPKKNSDNLKIVLRIKENIKNDEEIQNRIKNASSDQ